MQEFVITLTSSGTGTSTETVYARDTAQGIKERWERQGPGFTATVTTTQSTALPKVA